jgi:hypothetical protein
MASLLILRLIAGSSGTQRSTRLRRIAAASTMGASRAQFGRKSVGAARTAAATYAGAQNVTRLHAAM